MAAHRWDTEPAQILPSRLAARRRRERQAAGEPSASAGGWLDRTLPDRTVLDRTVGGALDDLQDEPAVPLPALRRRWRFPQRAAVLFVCLLLAAAVAIPLVQSREPHETLAVELGADVDTVEGSPAEDSALDQPGLDLPGLDLPGSDLPALGPDTGQAPNPSGGAPSDELPGGSPDSPGRPARAGGTGTELVVHVAGAVAAPGIVRIKSGGRVADAVGAAGGALPEADLTMVNLAAPMEDGSMVVVPVIGAEVPAPVGPSGYSGPSGPGGLPGAGNTAGRGPGYAPGAGGGAAVGPVNLNTATDAELQTLPRVGPVLAARIVAWRTDHGRFTRPEDLDAVPGIGEAMLAALLPLVTV